jgi:hypothetical protein
VQVGQAPCGLLKLKVRGSISGRLVPHLTQAKCSLKVRSRVVAVGHVGDDQHAVAQLERRLHRIGQARQSVPVGSPFVFTPGGCTMMRSITASMVCIL